jgi:hypothetical protein
MSAHTPISNDCSAALAIMHCWLDGDAVGVPPEVAAHLSLCADCHGRFAAMGQMSAALIRTESLPVPPLLTERIVAGLLADNRRQRLKRWSLAGVGLAASVALAVWLSWLGGPAPSPAPTPLPEMVTSPPPSGPGMQKEFSDAGEAVAALTRRTASDVVGVGRQFVSTMPSPPWPPDMEPAGRPFEEAGAALADGFEPVTTSARRAARLVWRELGPGDDKK